MSENKVLDLNKVLVMLDGQPIKENDVPLTIGKALGKCLTNGQADDPLRSYALAVKIYDAETIELDKSEVEYVIAAIKKQPQYFDLVRGQLLSIL